jgi:hypothetical protein
MTESKHPRHAAGLPRVPSNDRPRSDAWIGFDCGDQVRERDGRHVGVVIAIISGTTVRVRWLDLGWASDLDIADIIKVQ